ncbi:MAG TPA: hypothetical protein VGM87_21480 [Roseomonas sp.]|jgi:hypothetical protein
MFSVGQRVYHRDGRRSGRVVECDGDRVFIEQDNGAELDFDIRDLTTKAPEAAAQANAVERGLRAADITPEHVRVLGIIPPRTVQAVAALFERRPGAGRFGGLDVATKLNIIAEITAIPYRTMRTYSDRPGELGLMMGKGLADAQNQAEARKKG